MACAEGSRQLILCLVRPKSHRVLPDIHDHGLLGYHVSFDQGEIGLRTMPDQRESSEPGTARAVVFEGCVAHHFERADYGTILSDISEVPLERFVSEHAMQFDAGHRASGWPSWWRGSVPEALAYLRQEQITAFEIESSYGFSGWILARSVRASEPKPHPTA